jgi:hypothetical protein
MARYLLRILLVFFARISLAVSEEGGLLDNIKGVYKKLIK